MPSRRISASWRSNSSGSRRPVTEPSGATPTQILPPAVFANAAIVRRSRVWSVGVRGSGRKASVKVSEQGIILNLFRRVADPDNLPRFSHGKQVYSNNLT